MKKTLLLLLSLVLLITVSCQSQPAIEEDTSIYEGRVMEMYAYNSFLIRIIDSSDKVILNIDDDVSFTLSSRKDFYIGNNVTFEFKTTDFSEEILEISPYKIHENIAVTYTVITPSKGKEMMDSQVVIIVDVREQYEYDDGHIKNAQLIPVGTIKQQAPNLLIDKNANIIVYCKSGNRSKMAAEILVKLGYTNIFEMGGINSWPYDIVK